MSSTNVDQVVRYKGFDVEIKNVSDGGESETDSSWVTIAGGECFLNPGAASGRTFTEVTLRGPLAPARRSMVQWINESSSGKPARRTVSITLLPLDQGKPQRLVFNDALVTRYVPPRIHLDDPCPPLLVEELRFSYGTVVKF
jgi:hypothetical protein